MVAEVQEPKKIEKKMVVKSSIARLLSPRFPVRRLYYVLM
jgi:hypothetical protein